MPPHCWLQLLAPQDALAMGAIFAATDSVATLQVLDASTMPTLFSSEMRGTLGPAAAP